MGRNKTYDGLIIPNRVTLYAGYIKILTKWMFGVGINTSEALENRTVTYHG
jgi:hypothetical protein